MNRPNPTGSVYLNNDSASSAFTPNAQGLRVVNGGVYVVNGTFTVDSNLLIQNAAVFYFRKGAEVRVKPWATLTLDSVTFDAASSRPINDKSCMWKGIVLETNSNSSGFRLSTNECTIKFAQTAVLSEEGGAKYRLTETQFLNNLVALDVRKFTTGIHDGQYRGCTFEREPDSLQIGSELTYGVKVEDNVSIRFGNRVCSYLCNGNVNQYPLYSQFINLDYGIWGRKTSATAVWNEFINCHEAGIRIIGHDPGELSLDTVFALDSLTGLTDTILPVTVQQWKIGEDMTPFEGTMDPDGSGCRCYYFYVRHKTCFDESQSYSNYFEGCSKAIYSTASTRILVEDNAFESNGYAALVELSKKSSNWQCYSNCVRNGEKGFVGLENINMKIDFKDNDLERLVSLPIASFTTDPAIQMTQAAPAPVNSKNTMVVENNRIWNYGTGVWVSGRRNPYILNNRVAVPRHADRTYGIRIDNVDGDTVSCNRIWGIGTMPVSGKSPTVFGIQLSNSPKSHVVYDTISEVDHGIRALGACNHSNVWKNEFENYNLAFFLGGGTSLIGDQRQVIGSDSLPHDNLFGTLLGNISTNVEGYLWSESSIIASATDPMDWYSRLPVGSITFPDVVSEFSDGLGGTDIPITSAPFNALSISFDCPTVPSGLIETPSPIGSGKTELDSVLLYRMGLTFDASRRDAYLLYDSISAMGLLNARHNLLRQIWMDSVELNNSVVLDSFAQVHSNDAHYEAVARDWHLIQQESDTAYSGFHTYTAPRNLYFERLKTFSDIIESNVDSSVSYSITTDEIDSLVAWAQLCPEYYGAVVHRSRALLRLINPDYIEPSVACASVSGGMKRKPESTSLTSGQASHRLMVYPNPSEGNAFVHLRSTGTSDLELWVYNTIGMVVFKGKISPDSEVELPSKIWPEGIYIIRIQSPTASALRFIRR